MKSRALLAFFLLLLLASCATTVTSTRPVPLRKRV